ncbi:FAD-binding domain-containing protein [Rickenella mellea]|uniref:FAD-binding domain-containing protein n=1 Tax=Rickenella mellea TaxID=50990 RepID=A0A4Y7QKZ9_9AGAM|nr:FAD-binding domain-containing protein [Rickenella mellea]
MVLTTTFAYAALSVSSFLYNLGFSQSADALQRISIRTVCKTIQTSISGASNVYFPGALHYDDDIYHWAASSIEDSVCSVEPGSTQDVGKILQILGSTRTPFAVIGGGHSTNKGFSSTPGIQIAMYRFSNITYNKNTGTADVGSGLIWDEVYTALEPFGVSVIGGRVTGVGVAGFTLGGGYSWKTNQFGLTVDTVQAYELVLPNGTVTSVTATSNPDLFFGLRGGFNNFGIVTKFTFQTFPQGQVWGGLITFTEGVLPQVNNATTKFATTNKDPKAGIITTYNFLLGEPGVSQLLFYDGPNPPPGIFDDFLAIPFFTKDISTRSYLSLVQSSPSNATANTRGAFHTVSLTKYSLNMINVILNETITRGIDLSTSDSGIFISYDVEPFLPSLFSHGTPSAYPPDRSRGLLPQNIYYAWIFESADQDVQNTLRASANVIRQAAIAEGQVTGTEAIYGNYALFDTPLSGVYGANVPRLQAIKKQYDPTNVMGLAGGFKF